jgi:hypothetical protein
MGEAGASSPEDAAADEREATAMKLRARAARRAADTDPGAAVHLLGLAQQLEANARVRHPSLADGFVGATKCG